MTRDSQGRKISCPGVLLRLFIACLLLLATTAQATQRVNTDGQVLAGAEPLCALVLVNGQRQFTCDGTGRFDLDVPLGADNTVSVQAFADGFAPFRQDLAPGQASNITVSMVREADGTALEVVPSFTLLEAGNRALVTGTVNRAGQPVCALVLANGQSMFSCGEQHGVFSLDVPLDAEGLVSLMVFAAGFKPYRQTPPVPFTLTHALSVTTPLDEVVSARIGAWMFKHDSVLTLDNVADWLGRRYEDLQSKTLLEPINVVWVDFLSVDEAEATSRVEQFLDVNGFFPEGWPLHSPILRTPYQGFYIDASGNFLWRDQHGDLEAWVDAAHPAENNHGRIFPLLAAQSDLGRSVYITSAAFSRESRCDLILEDPRYYPCATGGHEFVSFKRAADKLAAPGAWTDYTEGGKLDMGNIIPLEAPVPYTTAWHDGTRVFALFQSLKVTITQPADGASIVGGELIFFDAEVVDTSGRPPPDLELEWRSDIDGVFARDSLFPLVDLSIGRHTITLTASISGVQGSTVIDQISLTVLDQGSPAVPDITGRYSGSYTIDVANCSDPDVNDTYHFDIEIDIDEQDGATFSGSATGTPLDIDIPATENISFSGTIDADGRISGTSSHTFAGTSGSGTFQGSLDGNTLNVINSGRDTAGDTCTYVRDITASR